MPVSHTVVAGDTLSFTTLAPLDAEGNAYSPGDGWSLTYRLIPRDDANSAITLNASTEDADTFRINASASTTATWGAGYYNVAAWVALGSDRYTVEPLFDQVEIRENPATAAAGFDGRSQAQKAYDDVMQAIADATARAAAIGTTGAATGDVIEYTIGERRVRYGNPGEARESLFKMRNALGIELQRERAAAALARSEADPRRVYLRSVRG